MSRSITTDALRDYAHQMQQEGYITDAGAILNAIEHCSKQEPGLSNYVIMFYPTINEVHVLDLATTGDQLLHEDIEAGFVDYIDYTIESTVSDDCDGGIIMMKEPISEKFDTDDEVSGFYENYRSNLYSSSREYFRIISENEYEKLMGHTLDERDY